MAPDRLSWTNSAVGNLRCHQRRGEAGLGFEWSEMKLDWCASSRVLPMVSPRTTPSVGFFRCSKRSNSRRILSAPTHEPRSACHHSSRTCIYIVPSVLEPLLERADHLFWFNVGSGFVRREPMSSRAMSSMHYESQRLADPHRNPP